MKRSISILLLLLAPFGLILGSYSANPTDLQFIEELENADSFEEDEESYKLPLNFSKKVRSKKIASLKRLPSFTNLSSPVKSKSSKGSFLNLIQEYSTRFLLLFEPSPPGSPTDLKRLISAKEVSYPPPQGI